MEKEDAFSHRGLQPPVGIFWFMLLPRPREKWDLRFCLAAQIPEATGPQGELRHGGSSQLMP